jgi:hypothetical protein
MKANSNTASAILNLDMVPPQGNGEFAKTIQLPLNQVKRKAASKDVLEQIHRPKGGLYC